MAQIELTGAQIDALAKARQEEYPVVSANGMFIVETTNLHGASTVAFRNAKNEKKVVLVSATGKTMRMDA